MKFEENMKKLREITQQLEKGEVPLEEAVKAYVQGMELVTSCQKELQEAKLEIEKRSTAAEPEE
jgi:exodeoxyribonuclease VII small subunit